MKTNKALDFFLGVFSVLIGVITAVLTGSCSSVSSSSGAIAMYAAPVLTITGRVLDNASSNAIANMRMSLLSGANFICSNMSSSNGSYSLSGGYYSGGNTAILAEDPAGIAIGHYLPKTNQLSSLPAVNNWTAETNVDIYMDKKTN